MSGLDILANQALIGQWLGVLGMLIVLGLMLRRRAKERREKAGHEAVGTRSTDSQRAHNP
jgi:hypothetical protein